MARVEEQISVRQNPEVIAIWRRIFPDSLPLVIHDKHLALRVVRAGESPACIASGFGGLKTTAPCKGNQK
jgi:hypothetical protein